MDAGPSPGMTRNVNCASPSDSVNPKQALGVERFANRRAGYQVGLAARFLLAAAS